MRAIRHCRFTAIDFESAGAARGQTDVPVQIGLACWSVDAGHGESFVSHLTTDRPVLWSARKVHGIRDEDLTCAPTLLSLWPELRARLDGAVVVAHGKGTEKRFLRAFPGHGFGPWVDTLTLSRAVWPDLPDHALGSLCDALSLTDAVRALVPARSWHDALFDATASLVVLARLIELLSLADQPAELLERPDTRRWHGLRRG
ncbi:MAG: 3'-5' exonuclease [Verrucomicrobia bacterium]|nr:3'-5' exonuclease [Verrucomicrobiota bacterium]